MKKSQIGKAVSIALAGSALAFGAVSTASAHVMYNTYNSFSATLATDAGAGEFGTLVSQTDGWNYGKNKSAAINKILNAGTITSAWEGTSSATATPFGYDGDGALNWAAMLHTAGDSLTVSQADSNTRYGIYADIDTAGGAWQDAEASPQGWVHNTDVGLIKSMVDQTINLNISAINGPIANFGVTVFTGMDSDPGIGLSTYSHHGQWNATTFTADNPSGTNGLVYKDHDDSVDSTAGGTYSFDAVAGQIYTIYLGGKGGLHWNKQHDGYVLDITTTSAVPVPAAAWLLGSGLVGLFSYGRRKNPAA